MIAGKWLLLGGGRRKELQDWLKNSQNIENKGHVTAAAASSNEAVVIASPNFISSEDTGLGFWTHLTYLG